MRRGLTRPLVVGALLIVAGCGAGGAPAGAGATGTATPSGMGSAPSSATPSGAASESAGVLPSGSPSASGSAGAGGTSTPGGPSTSGGAAAIGPADVSNATACRLLTADLVSSRIGSGFRKATGTKSSKGTGVCEFALKGAQATTVTLVVQDPPVAEKAGLLISEQVLRQACDGSSFSLAEEPLIAPNALTCTGGDPGRISNVAAGWDAGGVRFTVVVDVASGTLKVSRAEVVALAARIG